MWLRPRVALSSSQAVLGPARLAKQQLLCHRLAVGAERKIPGPPNKACWSQDALPSSVPFPLPVGQRVHPSVLPSLTCFSCTSTSSSWAKSLFKGHPWSLCQEHNQQHLGHWSMRCREAHSRHFPAVPGPRASSPSCRLTSHRVEGSVGGRGACALGRCPILVPSLETQSMRGRGPHLQRPEEPIFKFSYKNIFKNFEPSRSQ